MPPGRVARVECGSKENVRKIISGVDSHTVHGKTLRVRRLLEIVPGHGKLVLCTCCRMLVILHTYAQVGFLT